MAPPFPPVPPPTRAQDGGKFKLSRKSVLLADGEVPPPRAGGRGDAPEAGGEMPEVGRIYRGCRIVQIMPFGAFVEVRRWGWW